MKTAVTKKAQKPKTVQRYEIVQGKTINDLVRLVNLKTKFGWTACGGIVHTPGNFSDLDSSTYFYCQGMIKRFPVKKEKK